MPHNPFYSILFHIPLLFLYLVTCLVQYCSILCSLLCANIGILFLLKCISLLLYRGEWYSSFYPRFYALGPCKAHTRKITKRITNSSIDAYFFLALRRTDLFGWFPVISLSLKNIGDGIPLLRCLSNFAISRRNFLNNFNLAICPLYIYFQSGSVV